MQRTLAAVSAGIDQGFHIGGQVYVSLRGQVMADTALGLARPARDGRSALPMTPETITLWLSAGKPVTAVAVGRLWERGVLGLDDPVARHVPEFGVNGKDPIT